MRSKPSRLGLLGMAFVCAAFLAACNDSARLQFVTVAPVSGEIYVSAQPAGGVRGAARSHARPALQGTGNRGKRPLALPPPATATCGSLQYAATGLFSNGTTQDLTNTATWTSSNTSAATVSSTGLASGIGLGTTNIGASFNGVTATSEPLAVDQLNSITLSPSGTVTVPLGSSQSFFAIGNFTFAAGGTSNLDVSSQVTWNSSNMAVATIDTSGNATTVGTGTTTITATSCDGIMVGSATLIVSPAAPQGLLLSPATPTISTGTTTLFTAVELLSDGTTQALTGAVTWTSSTTTTATIDVNTGVALGLAVGTSTITATEAGTGFTGTTTLTVQAATARFAYVGNGSGNGGAGSISGYTVDAAGGTLTALTGSPFAAAGPQQVLIHPSGDFMYYIDHNGSLHVEDINSADGSLADSGQTPVLASPNVNTNVGVIDPTGRFIYVISDGDNTIFGFKITQTTDKTTNGALTVIPTMGPYTDGTLSTPTWIMTDRVGKYVYVVNDGSSTISEYSIDQTSGALSPLPTPTIATGNAPLFATTDVNGHIYVANDGTTQSVSGYTIGSDGQLTSVGADFPVTSATFAINVLTDPTGKYLYVLDSMSTTAGQVFAYNLNSSTGVIGSQIGTTAQPTGGNSTGMAIDPTGVFMAIDNNATNNLSLFKVSTTTGAPTPATPATVNTDTAPQFVVFYTAASGQ
jgi:6-phosphogluconolactonase (cycloisomerase 2 family)